MIKKFKKGSYKISMVTIVFFIVIGTFFLTNAVTGVNNKNPIIKKNSAESISKTTESLYKDKLIVIDPGHGGHDPGGFNNELKLKEKDIVLDIGLKLKECLEATGFKVHMTREDNDYIRLHERAEIANKLEAHAFLSIHVNAHSDNAKDGISVSYASTNDINSETLAITTNNSLVETLDPPHQEILQAPKLVVLKETKMPAISIELGYLTNAKEGELLGTDAYKQSCADSIHNGLVEYFNTILENEKNKL